MSHEIRTPLNGMLGMTQLLNDTPMNEQQQEYMDYLESSSLALLAVINDILDLSKIESGTVVLDNQPFNLRACLDETLAVLYAAASRQGLRVMYEIGPDVANVIVGDRNRLRQILLNLVGNAIKFTNSGDVTVHIGRSVNGPSIFRITDTGIGVPERYRDRLFDPFSQVNHSAAGDNAGTGLGLAICKLLIELMDGEIWYEENEYGGSTFIFTLPDAEASFIPLDGGQGAAVVDEQEYKGFSILIGEDNEINRLVLMKFLEKRGFTADLVYNGLEVLRAVKSKRYDLVFMDINMPEMNGVEAAQQIRAAELTFPQPIIIAVTANAFKSDREIYFKSGMDDYISKPIQRGELDRILTKYLPK
jgi:CheY-like chemotaxis protein